MGEHNIAGALDDGKRAAFMRALLTDLRALERMLDQGSLEHGVQRIGAEQELFLVDRDLRPAPVATQVLGAANDPRLTTEIARFNLEANLTPRIFTGRCLEELERELDQVVGIARAAAMKHGAEVLLTGILPTLRGSDLCLENLTPGPRYQELNRVVTELRGGSFLIHIKGLDELHLTHDNILMEACNSSFQLHLQTEPDLLVPLYNIFQAATAPVLAAAVNSPILFNHRLWHESRIALFQHAVDARSGAHRARSQPTRVGFGDHWLEGSVIDLFRQDIARYRVIFANDVNKDSLAVLDAGGVPDLAALRLHNGTIWRWNRPCFGVLDGKAHLRIENRALPAGPTVRDEVANAAFFLGLVTGMSNEYGDITRRMKFDDVKSNFFAAARHGLRAQLTWVDGSPRAAYPLILEVLLPLARVGLESRDIAAAEVDTYLGTIEERVRAGGTGARWMLDSFSAMEGQGTPDARARRLTAAMLARQSSGPVHTWPLVEPNEGKDWRASFQTVGQFMSTDLFTVRPDDVVDLAASMMEWRHIRHIPVEDDTGKLIGLVSHRALLRLLTRGGDRQALGNVTVREIMTPEPRTVTPQTPTLEAIALMRSCKVGCLPVLENGYLVGILTAHDFLTASAQLFEDHLRDPLPAQLAATP
jgi:CBS domain-containing protein/gamma-glutamyl:cysteine ligase YbdK (ATP-grasp superfamily)